ncbi:MAG: SRPBCC domain-containing protein [Deltaproteobacteria bacterium]|nr:MAG: SRPBCC domain-containing protein [Deltaproteobacteria bacterium]
MTEPKAHEKLTLRRIYDAPPERVFRAWTDPAELARWNVPADGWTIEVLEVDLRVGGHYRATFGPPGEEPYLETDEYREIVRPKRLVFTETISRGGTVLTQTLCTVEFIDLGGRTEVVLTDEGIGADVHRGGWSRALDNLARIVAGSRATST